jgi:dipeptidyl aminopeptidase/acylaminoacyl peptidase
MSPADLLQVPDLSEPTLSPDGRQLLYVLAPTDWEANDRVRQIWRTEADGAARRQMTTGPEDAYSPRWSPDGSRFVFLARRQPNERVLAYIMDNDGGEARLLVDHSTDISSPVWSGDGSAIYFLAREPLPEEVQERHDRGDDVFAFDEDYRQQHLWRAAVGGSAATRITEGDYSVLRYTLSRDGTRIACHRAPDPLLGSAYRSEVWIMEADGANAVQLTDNAVPEAGAEISPDNSRVLFTSMANDRFELYYNDRMFVVPAAGGPATQIAAGFPHNVERAQWSTDGRSILLVANMGVHSQIFSVDAASGQAQQLTEGDHSILAWHYEPTAQRHVFAIDERTNPGDVYVRGSDGEQQRFTHEFDYLASEYRIPRQDRITWKGADGTTVEGLIYYPLDYREGTRYPLVVQTHGGPPSSDKFGFGRWRDFIPVLTARGFMVFKPNYRGSTGYGDDFLRDMIGHYYQNAHLDVMAGVDHLIAEGLADSARMVKTGWSAGGHMTNKIITHTNRFKAASSGAGAVNWISMYGTSDLQYIRTPWFGGTPWQENAPIDAYWDHSPLKDIANVRTPTLILVGENDVRVPPTQSIELYRALKANGVPTHLYIAPREPHGWQEPLHQLFKINVELDWFEQHALGRTYEWAVSPAEGQR